MKERAPDKLLLIGAGPMAIDYAKVLVGQGIPFETIGRGEQSARAFSAATNLPVKVGGLAALADARGSSKTAIVAVGVEALHATTKTLLELGFDRILVEKPAGLDAAEIQDLGKFGKAKGVDVRVAYNRRFFSSVLAAEKLIAEDGGITSFQFEFTEWAHQIAPLERDPRIKANWLMANSTHVIDLAFFLGGRPAKMSSFKTGGTEWHPSGSIYAGSGVSERGALFSYAANWQAPGRWGVEVLTKKRRFIFRPMEALQVQLLGSVAIQPEPIEDPYDSRFKPGLYRLVEDFLRPGGASSRLQTLAGHCEVVPSFERIRLGDA